MSAASGPTAHHPQTKYDTAPHHPRNAALAQNLKSLALAMPIAPGKVICFATNALEFSHARNVRPDSILLLASALQRHDPEENPRTRFYSPFTFRRARIQKPRQPGHILSDRRHASPLAKRFGLRCCRTAFLFPPALNPLSVRAEATCSSTARHTLHSVSLELKRHWCSPLRCLRSLPRFPGAACGLRLRRHARNTSNYQ
jgi:hypothetical protein